MLDQCWGWLHVYTWFSSIIIIIFNFNSVNAMPVKALRLRSLEIEVIWLSEEHTLVQHHPIPKVFQRDIPQVAPVFCPLVSCSVWQRYFHECKLQDMSVPQGFLTQLNRLQSSFLTVRVSLDPHCCIGFLYKEVGIHFHCLLTHFYSFSTNIYRGNVFVSFFQECSQKVLQYLPRKLDPDPAKQLSMCLKLQTIPVTEAVCQNQDISPVLTFHFVIINYRSKWRQGSDRG